MKKIIVTGGNGFIGSNLIKYLIQKKYFVINIDKNTYSKKSYILKDLYKKNYIYYKLDINDRKKILKILKLKKPFAIFNLAAETHVDRSIDSPKSFIESNICGVFNLLEAIREYKRKIKLVHVSTDEVYGDLARGNRSSETSSYKPSSPYAASKASADHLIKSYVRTFGINATISNCCNNYGPRQFPEKLIPTLIFNILNNKELPIYGKGINSREWIYVKDHCRGLLTILNKGKNGESYNIGSGVNINNLNLTKLLLNIVKRKKINFGNKVKIKFVKDRPGHDLKYSLNSTKIKKNLGWKPKIKFKEGLNETFTWYYENKKFFKNFSKKLFFKRLGLNK